MQKRIIRKKEPKSRKSTWAKQRRDELERIPRDLHGWVDAVKYKPPKCLFLELIVIKDDRGKHQQAWWTGTSWDYWPKKVNDNIVKWRLLNNDERVAKMTEAGYEVEFGKQEYL